MLLLLQINYDGGMMAKRKALKTEGRNLVYAHIVKEIREALGFKTQRSLARAIKERGLAEAETELIASIGQIEIGEPVSPDLAGAILAVLGTTDDYRKRLHLALIEYNKNPSQRDSHSFGEWLKNAMRKTTSESLREWLKKYDIEVSISAIGKWRKGTMPVSADKINPLFAFFEENPDLAVKEEELLDGKRTMLQDILGKEQKLIELLGEESEEVFEKWVNDAFPLSQLPKQVMGR
jgi:transcriptional regulator with XRE-family HTH domain